MVPTLDEVAKRDQLRGLGRDLIHLDAENHRNVRGPWSNFGGRLGWALKEVDGKLFDILKPFRDTDLLEANGEEILDAFIRLLSDDAWRKCLHWYVEIASLAGRADLYFRFFALHESFIEDWRLHLHVLLGYVVRGGSIEIMLSLLTLDDVVRFVREHDDTIEPSPLQRAAMLDRRSMVVALIDTGAPLEVKHIMGGTALCLAVEYGHAEVVLELLGSGADVNSINDRGYHNYNFPDYSPLCIAAVRNNTNMVDILLAGGAHLGEERGTALPLHLAAKRGCLGPLDSLLAAGASVNRIDSDGRSALHMACLHAHPEILINRGSFGDMSRSSCAYSEGGRSLERLLLAGAQVDLTDNEGRSALHVACLHSHERAVELLVRHGASVKLLCHEGRSPGDVVALEALNIKHLQVGHRSPTTLDAEETSVADRISAMLRRASAWGRRGWLVVMRAHYQATERPTHQALSSRPPPPLSMAQNAVEPVSRGELHEDERDPSEFDRASADVGDAAPRFATELPDGLDGAGRVLKILAAEGEQHSSQASGSGGWKEGVVLLVQCPDEVGVFREVLTFL